MTYSFKDLVVDHVRNNEIIHVEQIEQNERMDICTKCEHISKLGVCKICSCVLKHKTKYAKAECPIKKW